MNKTNYTFNHFGNFKTLEDKILPRLKEVNTPVSGETGRGGGFVCRYNAIPWFWCGEGNCISRLYPDSKTCLRRGNSKTYLIGDSRLRPLISGSG